MRAQLFKMNDYELLYLIQQGSDEALELMFEKYRPLINARVKRFNITYSSRDDYIQEGFIMLNKAIQTYKMDSAKTFNKYFDMLLQRRYISLLRKNKTYQNRAVLMEEVNENYPTDEPTYLPFDIKEGMFSYQEHQIYIYKYLKNFTTKELSKKFDLTPKQIYNTTVRIKAKIKLMMPDEK